MEIKWKKGYPENKKDLWSRNVIALGDNWKVYKIACFNGTWQRTSDMVNDGVKKIIGWIELPNEFETN